MNTFKVILLVSSLLCISQILANEIESVELSQVLESRLNRDVEAYLGHNSFILSVRAEVLITPLTENLSTNQTLPQAEKQTIPPVPPQAEPYLNETLNEEIDFDLPALPISKPPAQKVTEPLVTQEQIYELKKIINKQALLLENQARDTNKHKNNQNIEKKLRVLHTKLLVTNTVNNEQVAFLRNLLTEKLNYSPFRGDTLTITTTDFPKKLMEQKPWYYDLENWLIILISALVLILLIMLLRKNRNKSKQAEDNDNTPPSAEPLLMQQQQDVQALRQRIISLSLASPDKIQSTVAKIALNEQNMPLLAASYQTLGRSIFTSIFPNIVHEIPKYINYLQQEQKDYPALITSLNDLLQMLTHIENDENSASHKPFSYLQKLSDNQVSWLIKEEKPRIKALVLTQLDQAKSTSVLKQLSPTERASVAIEIGQFHNFPIATFNEIAQRLAKKSQQVPDFENINADGTELLLGMLDRLPLSEQQTLLTQLQESSPEIYMKIREQFYCFDDLLNTPTLVLADALRNLERKLVATALYGFDDTELQHILSELPVKLKSALLSEIDQLDAPNSEAINNAQQKVVISVRQLLNSGRFSMNDLEGKQ